MKKWRPNEDEGYWSVNLNDMELEVVDYFPRESFEKSINNEFRTKNLAQLAAARIRKVLRTARHG